MTADRDSGAWVGRNIASLLGRSCEEAADFVRSAGLLVRVVQSGASLTMEYRANRVTLIVGEDERIVRVQPG